MMYKIIFVNRYDNVTLISHIYWYATVLHKQITKILQFYILYDIENIITILVINIYTLQ